MLWIRAWELYLQHFILFVTQEWARLLHYTMLERLATEKHSGLLGPFLSYEENEVLWIRAREPYSQHFILFVTQEWAQ